ncbi:MAG: alpha/beta hydrolase family protein [Gammaproteobacteria bacterium]|nr:alpha/beta hydrolase family protein [Gammaproteobacteria bacterium]
MRPLVYLSLALLLIANTAEVTASDKAKEKRWADQIADVVMVGDAVWLEAGQDKFLGLYTEASDGPKGAAIIMHGIGVHPDWPDVILPLRSQLPEQGWATLSIQMPVLHNEANPAEYKPLFSEVAPRINSAIKFLKNKGYKNLVLIGHSLGTEMGVYYLVTDKKAGENITSFVITSMSPGSEAIPGKPLIDWLKEVPVPMLDLYGTEHERATEGAKARLPIIKSKKGSEQKAIAGTGHFFQGKNEELVKTISDWISEYEKK